jgi:hydrogenase/urease accessory protein HupE
MKRLSLAFVLVPTVATAHPGDHGAVGLWHLLTEADHLAMIAVGLVVTALAIRKLRSRP